MKLGLQSYDYHENTPKVNIIDPSYSVYQYIFLSESERKTVTKAIEYGGMGKMLLNNAHVALFNFGFGDVIDGIISDSAEANNGDARKVFGTVLDTVPKFFELMPNAIFRVGGSDSRSDFPEGCYLNCRKNCPSKEKCKNANRRIKIYQHFVDSNYAALSPDYTFYGAVPIDESKNIYLIEDYVVKNSYNYIMVRKK